MLKNLDSNKTTTRVVGTGLEHGALVTWKCSAALLPSRAFASDGFALLVFGPSCVVFHLPLVPTCMQGVTEERKKA